MPTPAIVNFFESSVGIAFLHRLLVALHFVFGLLGGNSPRLICIFLELTGLERFVASSYGSQQNVCVQMENAVVDFGKEETALLAKDMEPKEIPVAEDETFHPEPCLVAIEPVSNFIVPFWDGQKPSPLGDSFSSEVGLPVS